MMSSPDPSELLVGAALLLAASLAGICALLFSRRQTAGGQLPLQVPHRPGEQAPGDDATPRRILRVRATDERQPLVETLTGQICGDLLKLLTRPAENFDIWSSFDQLLREKLGEHLGATRVRCYHVRTGCDTLQTLAQAQAASPPAGPSLRVGLLGHVATSGREYVAGDAAHGRLLDDLAAQNDDDWNWVWPVRRHNTTVGIVAVAHLRDPGVLGDELRNSLGQLISLCWQHVASVDQLRVVRRTDPATGVLTRNDFFALAGHALADSYRENEPVVVAVLTLEGLRRLDDAGRWGERDALIERLGQVIGHRVRSDDLVGRFADDRFVVLLRRLDSGLGRLIAEKLLAAADDCIAQIGLLRESVRTRAGVVGSGFAKPSLADLLSAGFEAVDQARRAGVPILTDLEEPRAEGEEP